MPKRIAGKVFEKLIRPGRFALAEASSALSAQMSETFDSALGSLSHSTGILGDLRQNFHALTRNFEWTRSPSGPFASCNFDSGHAHALLVGPGGIEERSDVRIGLLLMAPFTRFPDHIQYQARSFLALSPMEFSATQEGWKRVSVGELSYCGAGELVALRSVSKPLLCLWCNMERR
ncbi:hypothetical protein HJB84_26300 [Rhizobium sp. NZLR1b]|uniref:dimethylsulfonioproprionate lyase family protein n=1 Tax=unclassified Rhizobium TaxID=2613769 RepID=UPI001C837CE6|nr:MULTISPECIES: dimethylsulfonioproprionate lyase family protein [unclassified Rhizobium]MBX5173337.1 hypothetical protein [Rhizobium sp. NZLR1b]MBX5192596.1 hypothetical protein [Rhizobium sp. NZLR3b]